MVQPNAIEKDNVNQMDFINILLRSGLLLINTTSVENYKVQYGDSIIFFTNMVFLKKC